MARGSVRVAPFYVARSGLVGRRLAVIIVAGLRGGIGWLPQLILRPIPPVMVPTCARVMLRRGGHLHRRTGNQQRAENCKSCFSHPALREWTPGEATAPRAGRRVSQQIMSEKVLARYAEVLELHVFGMVGACVTPYS